MTLPRLAVTMGEPGGVGPEIACRALTMHEVASICRPVVYGDLSVMRRAAAVTGCSSAVEPLPPGAEPGPGAVWVRPVSTLALADAPYGVTTLPGARATADYIRAATADVRAGGMDAIVTCPITKEGLKLAGVPHPGHTEFIARMCGTDHVVMMLAGDRLRVALVTIHTSLRNAIARIDAPLVERTIRITDAFFRKYMATPAPRIAVAGLNPHAGEGGLFGDEESTIIAPAIAACVRDGIGATGPYPPDTIFYRAYRGQFDVVIAMTHDVGLAPLKLVHFDDGVNVTMGLPIIRTSVDHGTAFDIAGTGKAAPGSLVAALRMAAGMAAASRRV
jgi:4-phospho-D-threonate 3-dehydrogenase / 4-phospho-D-erythronate 3-dehydrogenase